MIKSTGKWLLSVLIGQLLAITLLLFFISFSVGQEKQSSGQARDSSGSWVLDKSQSSSEVSELGEMTLKISHRGSKFKVNRKLKMKEPVVVFGSLIGTESSVDYVYFTDGHGETNRSTFGPTVSLSEINTKTVWEDDKIVVRSSKKNIRLSDQDDRNLGAFN